ncbi:MAG: SAM-dependent DNA methyltransferase, partial [Clostridia bacterium]|nr:SAM-dependent DNA methyltransferase [Clostridia bacterium]
YGDPEGLYCYSKVFETVEFGYNKITVVQPKRDSSGAIITDKKGRPVAGETDTENVPLVEDIDAFMKREILPYTPDAWVDKKKTKVGYEIQMTRYFYKYQAPEALTDIVSRIRRLETDISESLNTLFHKESEEA